MPTDGDARIVEQDEVDQLTDEQHRVTLHKEVWELGSDPVVAMVRKHLPGGPTRPPVILVHGFAQNRYSWHTSRRSMSAWLAAQGWDTWNLELRGHGRSRAEGQQGAERFADYVVDLERAAAVVPGRAFWIGHSLGGCACYAAAASLSEASLSEASLSEGATGRHELLPRGIVGIGALYHFGQANWALRLLGKLTHGLRDTPWMSALQVRTRLVGWLLGKLYGMSDIAGYTFPISGWWPGSIEPDILQERLTRGFDWTSVKVWQEMSRWAATGQVEWDEAWAATDVPLLVLAGDEDHLMPPADARTAYDRSGSSDKAFRVFDDWHDEAHWGHLDLVLGRLAPRHVWPAVHDWMALRQDR